MSFNRVDENFVERVAGFSESASIRGTKGKLAGSFTFRRRSVPSFPLVSSLGGMDASGLNETCKTRRKFGDFSVHASSFPRIFFLREDISTRFRNFVSSLIINSRTGCGWMVPGHSWPVSSIILIRVPESRSERVYISSHSWNFFHSSILPYSNWRLNSTRRESSFVIID